MGAHLNDKNFGIQTRFDFDQPAPEHGAGATDIRADSRDAGGGPVDIAPPANAANPDTAPATMDAPALAPIVQADGFVFGGDAGAGPELAPQLTMSGGTELADPGFWGVLAPAFADLDGDGDLDLVMGTVNGAVVSFRNGGDGTSGDFALWGDGDPMAGIQSELMATPEFIDLDGDGDMDLVLGSRDHGLSAYRNGGTGTSGDFTAQARAYPFGQVDNYGTAIDPAFVDLDGDGDLDLVIGNASGEFLAYRNGDDASRGTFAAWTGRDPFANISVNGGSTPTFIDLDADGDLDLVTGTRDGRFEAFRNGTFGDSGDFVAWNIGNPFEGISVGARSDPVFADVDGDGDLDLVTGNGFYQIQYFENTAAPGSRPVFRHDPALLQTEYDALF